MAAMAVQLSVYVYDTPQIRRKHQDSYQEMVPSQPEKMWIYNKLNISELINE